ncbi:MAG: glycosyltransferase family 2 protein [Nitrospinota bacterium]
MKISVIMPVLDEEKSLPLVMKDIPRDLVEEIVVIDNGSSDGSAIVARENGATVLSEPRKGYGYACLRGIEYLKSKSPDIVVFLDADYSDYPEEIKYLVRPVVEEGYDMVIGSRVKGKSEKGAILPQARYGNMLGTFLIRILYGFRYTDLGPFRAIRFDKLIEMGMQDKTFGWTVEMQIKGIKKGHRITEVPVSYRKRSIGKSKVTGTIRGTIGASWKILWTIFKYVFSSPS